MKSEDIILPHWVANHGSSQAFGIKIIPTGEIVHIAKSAGYDSLFIDLEHTTLTLKDAGQLCITGLSAGVTPFVRVPHQCGSGFIQRVLDAGAMGVIVPHIHGVGMFIASILFNRRRRTS